MGRNRGKAVRSRERGTSLVEVTLLSPWIFLLFLGIFNAGMYYYALITVENAARVAVLHTSGSSAASNDSLGACTTALSEMSALPNTRTLADCSSLPLIVTAQTIQADDPESADALGPATRVTVQYQSIQLFPIPGMAGRMTITRFVQARVEPD